MNTNNFPLLPFCGPYIKPHGFRGLSKHYHTQFYLQLGHCICAIRSIPFVCDECTYILDKPWINSLTPQKQLSYQPVIDCNYLPVLGSFNNWNIITLSQKATTSEDFEEIFHVFLDGISDNMASLVQSGKYVVINTTDTSTMGYYVIKFVTEAYTLQYDTTCDVQIISAGEIFFKSHYLKFIQENSNWYWEHKN